MKKLKLMMMTLMMSLMTMVSFGQFGKINTDYNFIHTYNLKTNKSESENKRLLIKHFKEQSNIININETDTSLQYCLDYYSIDVVSIKEGNKLNKYLDIKFDLTFVFKGNNIEIKSNIIDVFVMKQSGYATYKTFQFSELVSLNPNLLSNIDFKLISFYNKAEKFINEYGQENNVVNENDGVDILLLAENQQDLSLGVLVTTGVLSGIMVTNSGNYRGALVVGVIGGISGTILYISSRVNKRKGLKQLKKDIKN
jgi:hypothetical protein